MNAMALLQQMEFCKTQISKYTDMYEKLMNDYRLLSMVPQSDNVQSAPFIVRQSASRELKDDSTPDENDDSTSDENDDENGEPDLLQEALDMIHGEEDIDLPIQPKTRIPPPKTSKVKDDADIRSDALIDELNELALSESRTNRPDSCRQVLASDKLRTDLNAGMKSDEDDFLRIKERKYNARAGVEEHQAKLNKIYAREKELLAQGLSPEEVRKRVREELYPEAIPAKERKSNPQIDVFVEGEDGKLKQKKMKLLAWSDEDFMDDNPELTKTIEDTQGKSKSLEPISENEPERSQNMPTMDLPAIDEENSLYKKVNDLLAEDDNPADIVNEESI